MQQSWIRAGLGLFSMQTRRLDGWVGTCSHTSPSFSTCNPIGGEESETSGNVIIKRGLPILSTLCLPMKLKTAAN